MNFRALHFEKHGNHRLNRLMSTEMSTNDP
jgi:hypothetical protein